MCRKTFDHRSGDPYNEYTYDDLDRLTAVGYHDLDTEAFNMDDLGNRTGNQTLRDDGTVNFVVDDDTNRYTSIGGNSITHDDAGNMTTDKDGYRYHYDYENRIVKIEKPDGAGSYGTVAQFDYDALGRRVSMQKDYSSGSPTTTTIYYYNPEWQVLAEYDGSSNDRRYFVYGNYIDEVLVMRRFSDSEDYFYGHDHLCSVVAIFDDAGAVQERVEYDAYGTAHIMDASYNARATSSYDNPYTFTGRRLDELDSGNLEVMYYRHRTYDTYTARFLQHDPLGIAPDGEQANKFRAIGQYRDGLSLYEYGSADPLRFVDPSGLLINPILDTVLKYCSGGMRGKWKLLKVAQALARARDGRHDAEVLPSHPFEHCVWSCKTTLRVGKERARELGNLKEDLDTAVAEWANSIPDCCWKLLPFKARVFLSDWVCSAQQESDYMDNETGIQCGDECILPSECKQCCRDHGVEDNTDEGPGTDRPYGKYCQGNRYEATMRQKKGLGTF